MHAINTSNMEFMTGSWISKCGVHYKPRLYTYCMYLVINLISEVLKVEGKFKNVRHETS